MTAGNEYRRAKRRKVEKRSEVFDCMTERVIGTLSDLSETGMLMIANQALVNDALYQLRFNLTEASGTIRSIGVGAHELWSDPAAAPGQVWIGFRFIDISAPDLLLLRAWVNKPGSEHV